LSVEVEEIGLAEGVCLLLMRQLVRLIMLRQGCFMEGIPVQMELEDGRARPIRNAETIAEVTAYSLPALQAAIAVAANRLVLRDTRLERSLEYFGHARYLMDVPRNESEDHSLFIQSSAFLFYWKSLTTILGDPAMRESHQTRFLQLGFPKEFWNDRVKPMKLIRDSADVAHRSLDLEAARAVVSEIPRIDLLCREVIEAYAEHLDRMAALEG
ncbi:MAG: hypothetical protein R3E83_19745, partial [Burkholderiaceae bacterium]